ncbi:MAG TPA: flagellar biosynthetic protein FliQ [Bacillota bacterium]|nr:flagellar biosynthetic protein FliQ [Bacillota bacterium]HOK68671.1 flagellar biosynthetic protein FliQ [Bacillota bacterium]HPP84783.1 flagellar biosynthetic protein FliQ [Bacillota bacterium]
MSVADISYIARDAIVTALLIAAPFLLITAAIGLFAAIMQAATQVQEQSIPFILKIVSVALVLLLLGTWIFNEMSDFTHRIMDMINGL